MFAITPNTLLSFAVVDKSTIGKASSICGVVKPSSNISNYTDKKGYIVVSSGIYSNIPENRTKEEIDSNNTEVLTTPQIDEGLFLCWPVNVSICPSASLFSM